MYIPKMNQMTDMKEAFDFMRRFSFATIITAKNGLPVATHLPFLVEMTGDRFVLISHFAKANEQWKDIETGEVLVIFTEPHAYISPGHYDKELNVPTWNYIAVHAYGQGKIIYDAAGAVRILEKTIDNYEATYRLQWDGLPENYKTGLVKGIIAFEIAVTDVQAKKKLSQNKTENERKKIINALGKSQDTAEKLIADYMQSDQ